MINFVSVGDNVVINDEQYTVRHFKKDDWVTLCQDGDNLKPMFMGYDYFLNELYQQQKQRADEYEKHWHELKKIGWKQFDIYAETDIVKAKAIEDFIKKMNELELKYTGKIEERDICSSTHSEDM